MDKCNRLLLFAVCDGHKGDKAAQFFCDNVVNAFWEATVEIEGKEGAIPLEAAWTFCTITSRSTLTQ